MDARPRRIYVVCVSCMRETCLTSIEDRGERREERGERREERGERIDAITLSACICHTNVVQHAVGDDVL
jgi:hypothetical protein